MTNATNTSAVAPGKVDLISIRPRAGIWRVALNGEFYGDYARRYWAIEAAFEKGDAIAARRGAAVITLAMDGEQDVLLYDTRRGAPSRREHAERVSAPRTSRGRRRAPLVGELFAQRLFGQAKTYRAS